MGDISLRVNPSPRVSIARAHPAVSSCTHFETMQPLQDETGEHTNLLGTEEGGSQTTSEQSCGRGKVFFACALAAAAVVVVAVARPRQFVRALPLSDVMS